MTHVHYKFSSKLSYDTVVFDGPHITLRDLKRQIMGREKLRAGDCDLQITNAQSKEEYTDDDGSIPKGSSVIVRRIPIIGAKSSSSSRTRNIERSDVQPHHTFGAFKAMDDQNSSRALPFFSKMANLADADVSEEDKLKVMMNQSYDSMNYNKKFGTVLPTNYTCYRCGNTGHHIRNCPTSGQDKTFEAPLRIKKSTGIPRSFMVEVDDPNIKGAMLTNCGRYAIPSIDIEAYAIGKKERPPFVPQEQQKSEDEEEPVPEELLCLICHDLLSDAVVIPCCGNSYCDDCIRTALLDSEEHVCPTCGQSDVSPDTLIGNKFLRQAVDNFKKERGFIKSLGRRSATSQSQNPTQTQSPVPTPPLVAVQSQPQKLQLSTHSQQDPLVHRSQAADTPPPSQVCVAPPTATGPASAPNAPSTSLQPVRSLLEIPDKEAEEKTSNDSAAAAAPSVPASPSDPAEAPSQLMPLVNLTPVVEQPQTVSVNLQQPSSDPASRPSEPSKSWDSSTSSSGCPTRGWNESNPQQIPPSVSSYTTPPPLFPPPHFHPFLAAQQPLSSYPPGYPPTTPVWTLPNLQGAPIPSLCPSTPIPALIPKEWYRHQRKKKERSPHRGSSHRRSSSRSNSKSSKSKSSRSYSRSSSRSKSRSRSRSQGRSRPHSPYSRHRDLHTRSHSSRSYSYGYKRSPTQSSSSSPRVSYHSRPRSPSDHRKNSRHSRHHNKRSASSSSSSRRRGEHDQREAGGSRRSLASHPYAQSANQSGSLELDRERYLQWEREYKEWCDKYFSSYVGHFHQLPVPLLSLPPPPQWGDREGSRNHAKSESRNRLQGRHTTRMDGRSPPSQSSSDSRSPPSRSSRESRSTTSQSLCDSRSALSQSSSDSRSSPSHSSSDSCSPPSRSSRDSQSTPSKDGAHPREHQQKCKEKNSHLPHTKGSKQVELQEGSKDDKQPITRTSENLNNSKHEQKGMKKHKEPRGEESSSPDAVDSTDDCRKDKKRHSTGPKTCKDGTPPRDEATSSDALESVQPPAKPYKRLDKDYERKKREQKDLEKEKERRRGKDSNSRQDVGRRHKEKPSKEADRVDAVRYPGGSRASDRRSEKNRKRKGEDAERSVKAESSKCLKSNTAEDPKRPKSESLNLSDRKNPKTEKKQERKAWPLTERDIWEGGIKVKPQKKISININLEGKKKEERTESVTGKPKESEKAGDEEEEKLNSGETEIEANIKKESSRDVEEEKIKAEEGEAKQKWEKATFRDDKEGEMLEKITGEEKDIVDKKEDREKEDFALRAVEEKKESEKQWDERDRMEACEGEEVTNDERLSVRGGKEGRAMGELVAVIQKEKTEEESTSKDDRGNPPGESKPKEELMEEGKWKMRKEDEKDTMESQQSRNESHHDRPNTTVDDGSSHEDHQERKTVVKTLEEFTQDRAADREDELVLIQVPRSRWEKEESDEEERDEGVIKVQPNALTASLPSPSVSVTAETTANRETEEKRERSVEMERGRDRETEKKNILSTSHTSVAPSSGKEGSDSALCTDRAGEKRMETERWRDRDRGRERDRQRESKRSKERTREEEKRRDRERERGHSSGASAQKRNLPSSSSSSSSSSHSYFYSTSHDTDRRDTGNKSSSCPGGKSSGGRSRESRAPEVPDQNTHKSCRDTLQHSKFKDHPHCCQNHQDPSGNHRPAGTRHSPPSLSHSRGKERDPLSKEEWKVRQVVKEGKGERENEEMVAEREGGSQREDNADKTEQQGRRELEEGERPSSRSNSVSSSTSQEDSGDDGRKERKRKQKKHKKEKRRCAPELLEEGELKRHKHKKKTSKKSRDGKEENSNGEVDDHTKLHSVMLS